MTVGAKIYNRILLDRLRPNVDPKLGNNQNGFSKGKSPVVQILYVDWFWELNRKTSQLLSLLLIQSTGGNLWKC